MSDSAPVIFLVNRDEWKMHQKELEKMFGPKIEIGRNKPMEKNTIPTSGVEDQKRAERVKQLLNENFSDERVVRVKLI